MNEQAKLCRQVYALLITVAAGVVAGRILATERVYEPSIHRDESDPNSRGSRWPSTRPRPMPTFSSNDRARWATIRSLIDGASADPGDEGTFIVGRRDRQKLLTTALAPLAGSDAVAAAALVLASHNVRTTRLDSGIIFEDGYQSVDKVMAPGSLDFYSTKPPLFPVLVAGLYWLLQLLTGWTLANDPAQVVRTILLLVNLLPFILYLVLMSRLVERHGATDWGRLYVMTAACFATFVTTFATSLSNHLPAMFSVFFAMLTGCTILEKKMRADAAEPGRHLFVLCGLFSAFAVCNEFPALAFAAAMGVMLLRWAPRQTLLLFVPPAAVVAAAFIWTNYQATGQFRPIQTQFNSAWYQYEGSHWLRPAEGERRYGIDWAGTQETRLEYAFHVLVGHHGLFSLTPLWLLALVGMCRWSPADVRFWLKGRPTYEDEATVRRRIRALFALLTLLLTVVVVGFYLVKSDNYGGFTSGLRWLMWLTPLWLFTLLPVADDLGVWRRGRVLAYVLLGFSVLSVSYPALNPWRHPWLYNLLVGLGWPGY